jgi:putative methyltransferase (TIGR04325 family)
MSVTKVLVRDWLPPAVVRWVRQVRQVRDGDIRFEGEFATWEEASMLCKGYDAEDILAKVLAATLKVKRGEATFERDSVLFDEIEYAWPVLAGLLWAAARNGGTLNVLDFGGALGSSYFQNLNILQTLPDVQWNVVEQEHYVDAGRAYIQDEVLRFYKSIEECLAENKPNVILLSSVLQYLSDPKNILFSALDIGADVVIIDRTIINHTLSDKVYVQHVPVAIYNASYPCRSLSEPALLATVGENYRLQADFQSLNFNALKFIESEFKGYIFERAL